MTSNEFNVTCKKHADGHRAVSLRVVEDDHCATAALVWYFCPGLLLQITHYITFQSLRM